jgi:hypothetical protein
MPAIAKDRNSICQYQRFLERLRNKYDRNAATLQIAHEVEEILLFFRRSRLESRLIWIFAVLFTDMAGNILRVDNQ